MQTRMCNGCTACCHTHAVPELKKPLGVTCGAVIPCVGCGNYASRPQSCQMFGCAWLYGHGTDDDRPDKSGIVCETVHLRMLGRAWQLVEEREGAISTAYGQKEIDWGLSQGLYVDLRPRGRKRTILIPPGCTPSILARCMYEGEDTMVTSLERYRERQHA